MSIRHLRARLDRLEESVKQRLATLPLGPAAAGSGECRDEPYCERIELLRISRIFGQLSAEEESELARWEAMYPPVTDADPNDWDIFDVAAEKAGETATGPSVRPRWEE